jgi:hypothetical protein
MLSSVLLMVILSTIFSGCEENNDSTPSKQTNELKDKDKDKSSITNLIIKKRYTEARREFYKLNIDEQMLPENQTFLNRINVGEMNGLIEKAKYPEACKLYETFDSTTQSFGEIGNLITKARNGLKAIIAGNWHGWADQGRPDEISLYNISCSTNCFEGTIVLKRANHVGVTRVAIIRGGSFNGREFFAVAFFQSPPPSWGRPSNTNQRTVFGTIENGIMTFNLDDDDYLGGPSRPWTLHKISQNLPKGGFLLK